MSSTAVLRVYCPGCGTVRRPDDYRRRPKKGDVRVIQHSISTGEEPRLCPGGAADPEEDRAP